VIAVITGLFAATAVNAGTLVFEIDSLSGTIDPIRYTTAEGTFITDPIALILSADQPSRIEVDPTTGFLAARTVMTVNFHDGRGNALTGIALIEESGTTTSGFTIISRGVLIGAGPFSGTTVKGRNPFRWEYDDPNDPESGAFVIWTSRPSPPPQPPPLSTVAIDLPSTFLDGTNIPLTFDISAHASFIPEPSTVLLLGTGLIGFLGYAWRNQRHRPNACNKARCIRHA
jgi:hypothetical protein